MRVWKSQFEHLRGLHLRDDSLHSIHCDDTSKRDHRHPAELLSIALIVEQEQRAGELVSCEHGRGLRFRAELDSCIFPDGSRPGARYLRASPLPRRNLCLKLGKDFIFNKESMQSPDDSAKHLMQKL